MNFKCRGSVMNLPPGSGFVIRIYGSADPDLFKNYLQILNTGFLSDG
jgi:hypothetical protein